jgi:prepilin-type N-terminal cleavage/methylation domain-containing protein
MIKMAMKPQSKAKNGGLLCFVKNKCKINLGRHPVFITGSGDKTTDKNYSPRPRYKNGVTSQNVILNLIGLLKYAQTRKINTKSRIVKAGFTLVELAIVLVIIGLVVGGVLVGQDLIYAAKVRSQIKQVEEIETQMNTFRTKYNCTAGDCANATDFFGTTDAQGNTVRNGNGNGIIKADYSYGSLQSASDCLWVNMSGEVSQFFMQLYLAGIGKDYTKGDLIIHPTRVGRQYPYIAFGNGTGVIVSCIYNSLTPLFLRQGNIIVIGLAAEGTSIGFATGQYGMNNGWGFGVINAGGTINSPIGIPADVARRIDEKIDNGLPNSGKFGIISGETGCNNTSGAMGSNPYPAPSVSCNVTAGKKID